VRNEDTKQEYWATTGFPLKDYLFYGDAEEAANKQAEQDLLGKQAGVAIVVERSFTARAHVKVIGGVD
jgi:hypothetical protein